MTYKPTLDPGGIVCVINLWVVGVDHPWVKTPRKARIDLRTTPWVVREPGSGTREATDQALLPHLRSYRRSIEFGSSEAIKQAAAEGLGVACLSSWVVDDLVHARRLAILDTRLPPLKRRLSLIWHREKTLSTGLGRFIAHCRALQPGSPAGAQRL